MSKLKNAFIRFRAGLEANKIFFEIIVMGGLTYMAITLSDKANQIAETQTTIMEQENLPQLEIRMRQDKNPATGIYENDNWLVFNRGGKLTDFDMKEFSFVTYVVLVGADMDTLKIPVYNYLAMSGTLSGEGDGLIYDFDNQSHGALENEIRQQLLNHGIFEVHSFAKITYKDLLDNVHNEYYRLSPGINRIPENEFNVLDSLHQFGKHETFTELKAQYFLNYKPQIKQH